MPELVEANEIMFTPFEPKMQNRFILTIDGVPSYTIKASGRPEIQFEEVEDEYCTEQEVKDYVKEAYLKFQKFEE